MFIRVIELIAIVGFLVGGIGWILWEFVVKPREAKRLSDEKHADLAIVSAVKDYKQIRQSWLDLALGDKPENFGSHMNDMSIEEVRRFQKHMVSLNNEYGKLETAKTDEVFVQKVVLLRELFDNAIIKTNQIEK